MIPHLLRCLIMTCLLSPLGLSSGHAATVTIDGSFEDWEAIDAIYANPSLPPGTKVGNFGVSFIKTYQAGDYVYFCYAALSPSGGNSVIAFDLDQNSDPRATYATINAEAAWELGTSVFGPEVLTTSPTAAGWSPDPALPGYQFFEWCFYRNEQLLDGTLLFGNPGDEVWFTVGTQGATLASSQITTFTLDLTPVPESSTALLLGLATLLAWRRRR